MSIEEEQKMEEVRLQMQRRYREEGKDSVAPHKESFVRVKLSKFVMTKLNWIHLDNALVLQPISSRNQ